MIDVQETLRRESGAQRRLRDKSGAQRRLRDARHGENGSISILIFGLFFVTVILIFIITDFAAMVVAQKSLVSATESSAMHASHALDLAAYYRGENGPGVPIDCSTARTIVERDMAAVLKAGGGALRPEMEDVKVVEFICFGDELEVASTAKANLPFVLPGTFLRQIELSATIGVSSKRKS